MIIKDPIWIKNKNIYGVQLVKLEDVYNNYENCSNRYLYYIKKKM